MKRSLILTTACLLLLLSSQAFAFERQSQLELFGGFAVPLAPDAFKDYYKVGLSAHGQYVIFPHPQFGVSFGGAFEFFTFNDGKLFDELEQEYGVDLRDYGVEIEGSARIIELGLGVRPYLTPVTSSFQLFLFGMGTFNFTHDEFKIFFNDPAIEDVEGKYDGNNIGIAAGGGLEIPAGNMNIIFQGLTRFIFNYGKDDDLGVEGETLSFIGFTTGIVF